MKNVVVLGSSGSIGRNALWVISRFPEEFNIFGLSVHHDLDALSSQVRACNPEFACVADDSIPRSRYASISKDTNLLTGADGLEALASHPEVDIVLNAVSGFAGLRSTLAAAAAGKRIALANKESMVAGGELVNRTAARHGAEIIPVDSEHSAIFQCLKSGLTDDIRRLILTSSGGPFRELPPERFPQITVEQALNHPTWNMGKKITIDSATMMNKALELIEAVYLFRIPQQKIDIVIHPQSIVHSMVEYVDGSIIAQLSKPDMRLPIQFALFYPHRRGLESADLQFTGPISLQFHSLDDDKFPSVNIARDALDRGGSAPVALNAANEVAADAFLNRGIKFTDIYEIVKETLNKTETAAVDNIEDIVAADKKSREIAEKIINGQITSK